ncbi:MAG: redox-sensing transcriptional repressor Rex [Sphaerochaetaceae bacterium]|jgi:redox-sensing transcriptional repressor|nr:redox-sensing transcriptional repressor Rex [Sphaerochaetaceae bacterium]HHU88751.1 redox-sensing transcriptional repressor Rex [Spirochaetales bacterium]
MISIPTIKRFPSYLRLLRQYKEEGKHWVSATHLAKELGLTPIQVRKDMAGTGVEGKPKVGFEIESLISAIICNLGWDTPTNAILVGAGHLGGALARYDGFATYGLHIVALFDADPAKKGLTVGNKVVKAMEEMESYIKKHAISIAVVAVPADVAQEVVDHLVEVGIKAIWNFAPKDLRLPPEVVVERTDLATSFAVLSAKFRRTFEGDIDCVER